MIIASSILCLTMTLYHEARSTKDVEQLKIAQVVINRSNYYHAPICKVVFEPKQFSWTNNYHKRLKFNNIYELKHYYHLTETKQFYRALFNAQHAIINRRNIHNRKILNYIDNSINPPVWTKHLYLAQTTQHFIFYELKGTK